MIYDYAFVKKPKLNAEEKVDIIRKHHQGEISLVQEVGATTSIGAIIELDAATLNCLIKEIVVHEHIDSNRTRHISIEIHFDLKSIPEVEQVKG